MISNSEHSHIKKLHQKKFREKYGEYLVEGKKGVEEVVASDREVVMLVVDKNSVDNFDNILNLAKNNGIAIKKCNESQANKIKTTKTFPGILAVIKTEKRGIMSFKKDELVICLDRISDPGNLGTIIRTADWFDITNILISEDSVEARNEKVVRSSMGSFFHVNIVESNNIQSDLNGLKEKGYELVGLDLKGKKIKEEKLNQKAVYIFGNESHGLSDNIEKMLDTRYTIEGGGEAESLNIGVSAGIVFFHLGA